MSADAAGTAPSSPTNADDPAATATGAAGAGGRILEWKHITGAGFQRLDPSRCVALVTFSPLEVHGPHLPVITDNAEGEALLLRAAEKLAAKRPDKIFLRMPPMFIAADVLPHRGSVMYRPSTIVRVAEDLGRSLSKQGFRDIWVGNFHGGPRHFVPIEVACDRVNARHGGRMLSVFSLLLTQLTGGRNDLPDVLGRVPGIDRADLVGDSHGGLVETSMMLHLLGAHVEPGYESLPRRTVDISQAEKGKAPLHVEGRKPTLPELLRGMVTKLKYYEDETYSGSPARGSAEVGARVLEVLSDHAVAALEDVLDGRRSPSDCHSPLWRARWLFTSDTAGRLFERAIGFKQRVF